MNVSPEQEARDLERETAVEAWVANRVQEMCGDALEMLNGLHDIGVRPCELRVRTPAGVEVDAEVALVDAAISGMLNRHCVSTAWVIVQIRDYLLSCEAMKRHALKVITGDRYD